MNASVAPIELDELFDLFIKRIEEVLVVAVPAGVSRFAVRHHTSSKLTHDQVEQIRRRLRNWAVVNKSVYLITFDRSHHESINRRVDAEVGVVLQSGNIAFWQGS